MLIDIEKVQNPPELTIFHKGARFQDISRLGSQK